MKTRNRFNLKFGRSVITAVLMLLSSCAGSGGAGSGAHGGDKVKLLFSEGRELAVDLLNTLEAETLRGVVRENLSSWIIENQTQWADDVDQSEHDWTSADQSFCALTSLEANATISLSVKKCEIGVKTREDAALILLHESVHHFGITDERFADEVALIVADRSKREVDGIWTPMRLHGISELPTESLSEFGYTSMIVIPKDSCSVSSTLAYDIWQDLWLTVDLPGPARAIASVGQFNINETYHMAFLVEDCDGSRELVWFFNGKDREWLEVTVGDSHEDTTTHFVGSLSGEVALYRPALDGAALTRVLPSGPKQVDLSGYDLSSLDHIFYQSHDIILTNLATRSGVRISAGQPSAFTFPPSPIADLSSAVVKAADQYIAFLFSDRTLSADNTPVRGAIYRDKTNDWVTIALDGSPEPAHGFSLQWEQQYTGTVGSPRFVVFGGRNIATNALSNKGHAYELSSGKWLALETEDAPEPRADGLSFWTGERHIIWGGAGSETESLRQGAIFAWIRDE